MATTPIVSVCIPSYNHAKYVRAALESVLSQDFGDFEIIITDDGSTDGTVEEVLAVRDERIHFARNERNVGPSVTAARNMARARGRYFAFLPSDDLYLPGKLRRQVEAFERQPDLGAVFSWMTPVDDDGAPIAGDFPYYRPAGVTRESALRHFFFEGNLLSAPTVMVRREGFERVGVFDPCLWQTQDYDMWVKLCLAFPIHVIEEALVAYRLRAGGANMHASNPATDARVAWEFVQVLRNYFGLEQDPALFLRVFPEAAAHLEQGFGVTGALALIGLGAAAPAPRHFGIEALYRALNTPDAAAALERAGHGCAYFYRALAEVDPLRTGALREIAKLRGAAAQSEQYAQLLETYNGLVAYHQQVTEAKEWWQKQAEAWEAQAKALMPQKR
ncbi:glycosyltransferase family 2 protein [Sediminicoccus rosea]|uniref:Glycosyltransferase n=1 Tax=Sediminicoccus rosea TaxID=1225128 RepID=A0ABZ0PCU6_9PROT|nr:glycosyltransferase [Sediminicoccus rosea]WPB83351.1 glycosyltransferase [Sediminicoccus rosea]